MNLLEAVISALRLPELRNKLLFTGLCLFVFRCFASIPIPGVNTAALQALFNGQALLGLLDLFSGGGLSTFSVVAMGMNPYINASIIMQLMTVVSLRLKEVYQEQGEWGKRRFTRWTRYLAVALAVLQSFGLTTYFQNTSPAILPHLSWYQQVGIMLTMTSGTIMIMWLGELITEFGIGNGISLIIFSGIIGRAPTSLYSTITSQTAVGDLAHYLPLIGFAVIALITTAGIIEVQQAYRKIPIQSAQRVGNTGRTVQGRASYLPIRVNTAGVIPIIFAISIMTFPTILSNYATQAPANTWYYQAGKWIQANFQPTGPNIEADVLYNVLYFLFVFGFTYFYTVIIFNVEDTADNLKRYSSFIPGIRPGAATARYLETVLNRVTFAGAIFLGLITVVLPLGTAKLTSIPQQQLYLGGTAILIVVGVALDTMKQLETQLVMRQYRGFIR